jgi:hypothetical protein
MQYLGSIVELLNFHTTTQSHWSSRTTVCFLPRGAAIRTLGVHPHFGNWDLLLAMSRYIHNRSSLLAICEDLSHRLLLPPFLSQSKSLQSLTDYRDTLLGSCKAQKLYLGRVEPYGSSAFSHHYTVSLVLCVNRLLPAWQQFGRVGAPHVLNWDPVSNVLLQYHGNFLYHFNY